MSISLTISMFLILWQLLFQTTVVAIQVKVDQNTLTANSLTNIYVDGLVLGDYKVQASTACQISSSIPDIAIGSIAQSDVIQPTTKLVWFIPASLANKATCIKLYNNQGVLIATSGTYNIKVAPQKKKGDWNDLLFDATKFNAGIQRNSIVAHSKDKRIGIIGAGASGLFSAFLLDSVGFHNYEVLEASERLGGRIHTAYFGKPEEYRYQELGPTRIPYSNVYNGKTVLVKDHQLVFQLANELNRRNMPEYQIKFIDWIQHDNNTLYYKNGIRLPNGSPPTQGDVKANPSLKLDLGETGSQADSAFAAFSLDKWKAALMDNIYTAYQSFLDQGGDGWPEWSYVFNKIGKSFNISALAAEGSEGVCLWGKIYEGFTMATQHWKTIDQGINRLANAFQPLVGNKVRYKTKVSKLMFVKDDKVAVQWKSSPFDLTYQSKIYDRVIVSAPFSVVRTWHLPQMSYTISKAINTLGYQNACKLALEFKTRFWEQGNRPIAGACSDTDTSSGEVCYPSYGHADAAGGRGVVLGSYAVGDLGTRMLSLTEQEHTAVALENLAALHGEQVWEQFTGNSNRYCGALDPLVAASWARPLAGQRTLFIPSYFNIERGLVFVGEHTDIKNGWISAALSSALRGVVMILVEAGHVDDARYLVQYWNAPWMNM